MQTKHFLSPGFGLLLEAPSSWLDTSTEKHFQVTDPASGAQFTASAYGNPGIDLMEWAQARLGMMAEGMPFMREIRQPYSIKGRGWDAIAAEFRGVFPEQTEESHYFILCLRTDEKVISFTITSSVDAFVANEDFYRELLTEHLRFATIVPMGG